VPSATPQPVTLFTGQWTDLPLEAVARLASEWGYGAEEAQRVRPLPPVEASRGRVRRRIQQERAMTLSRAGRQAG